MMKRIVEWLAGAYFAGECYVLYCVGATCWGGQPFPQAAQSVGVALIWGAALALVLGALWLSGQAIRCRRRSRRLGVIRMDREGRFYYKKM